MNKVSTKEKQINRLVKKAVAEAFSDFLKDPDFGLELQDWVKNGWRKNLQKLFPCPRSARAIFSMPEWSVEFTKDAERDLKKLDRDHRKNYS
ncbi:MAG: hypothetical protein G01um101466_286 [Parcubacteria group bacterium Gr01-1014_66]|nr:MAG: hypothetical protein G01um101466_286 [Parcubacteria group bacterium Gr01-1014_66]